MAVNSLRLERVADCGIFAAYTMIARRRSGRAEPVAAGPAGGAFTLRSEQFGFVANLPSGWLRQSGDAFHVERYGLTSFQDTALLTPSGAILRVAIACEPARPSEGAMDHLVALFEAESRGDTVIRSEADSDTFDGVDLAVGRSDGTLALARLGIAGRRVVCIEGMANVATDDEVVRDFFSSFELLRGEPWDPKNSGTFVSPGRGLP